MTEPSEDSSGRGRIGRRALLAGVGAAAVLAGVKGCGRLRQDDKASIEQALRLLREAVRASPDHLGRRADEVAGSSDAGRIVAFVRDRIAVVPQLSEGTDVLSGRIGGPAAVLRGGAGTLRDRADLLAGLLGRAGFRAEVRTADRPAAITQQVLYRPRQSGFEPDRERLDRARDILGRAGLRIDPPAAGPAVPDPVPRLLAALPGRTHQGRADLLPASVPVVRYDDHGTVRYAFALGDLDPVTEEPPGLSSGVETGPLPAITVTVFGLANPTRGSRVPRGELIRLVHGEWPADAVLGRQLLLTFVPPRGAQALLAADPADLPLRVPTLRVQAPGRPKDLVATGPLMTVQGEIFTTGGDIKVSTRGLLTGPFGPIKPLSAANRKAAIDRADRIEVVANAGAFPEVELDVAVLDRDGRTIEGLDAASFTVTEQGDRVSSVAVTSNAVNSDAPRVLIAYDASGSVGDTWPSEQARTRFEQSLASTLAATAARTRFDVQVLGLGSPPSPPGWRRPVPEEILTALRVADPQSSVWQAVGGAALDQGAVAIVLVSDNRSDEEPGRIAVHQRRLAAAGVPVFCLPIGDPDERATAQLVALSHGTRLDPTHPSTAGRLAELIRPLAAKRLTSIYRLRYTAPAAGPVKRRVTVTLAGRDRPAGADTYTKPAEPVAPPSFVGLYAEIGVNGNTSLHRLAGLAVTWPGGQPAGDLDDPAAAAATRAAMYGVTTIAVEPGTTTTAALLDDVLGGYLSIEPLRPAWKTATAEQLVKAVGSGVLRTPGLLADLLGARPPVDGAADLLRVAILQERQVGPDRLERHLRQASAATVALGTDPGRNFAALLTLSAGRAVAEAAVAEDSAVDRLSGQPLTVLPAGDPTALDAFVDTLPAARRAAWRTALEEHPGCDLLVPAGGRARAFWAVDGATGTAIARSLDSQPAALPCGQTAARGGLSLPVSLLDPNSPLIEIPGVGPVDLNAVGAPADPINRRIAFGHASTYLGASVPSRSRNPVAELLRALECS